jgi:predicted HAD superfamily Cof-like phosphohydrolase
MIKEFHETYGLPVRNIPQNLPHDELAMRMSLITEEVTETFEAAGEKNISEVFDGLIDTLYVVIGMAVQMGLGDILDDGFKEVHRSNMSKLGEDGKPVYRADGKVLKGPNFKRPDLLGLLEEGTFPSLDDSLVKNLPDYKRKVDIEYKKGYNM